MAFGFKKVLATLSLAGAGVVLAAPYALAEGSWESNATGIIQGFETRGVDKRATDPVSMQLSGCLGIGDADVMNENGRHVKSVTWQLRWGWWSIGASGTYYCPGGGSYYYGLTSSQESVRFRLTYVNNNDGAAGQKDQVNIRSIKANY